MSENLKPMFFDVASGTIKIKDEQDSASSVVKILIGFNDRGDITCNHTRDEIAEMITAGSPVMAYLEGEGVKFSSSLILLRPDESVEILFCVQGGRYVVSMPVDGDPEIHEFANFEQVLFFYEDEKYHCSRSFDTVLELISNVNIPVLFSLEDEDGNKYSGTAAKLSPGDDKIFVYFKDSSSGLDNPQIIEFLPDNSVSVTRGASIAAMALATVQFYLNSAQSKFKANKYADALGYINTVEQWLSIGPTASISSESDYWTAVDAIYDTIHNSGVVALPEECPF
ncbi:MAG: hypothetical protein J6S84_08900 [Bacteroidales bacterium]|nr:hypothetical protein [Bacteroidales bacterium]